MFIGRTDAEAEFQYFGHLMRRAALHGPQLIKSWANICPVSDHTCTKPAMLRLSFPLLPSSLGPRPGGSNTLTIAERRTRRTKLGKREAAPHAHPESVVYISDHSWCCTFYGFWNVSCVNPRSSVLCLFIPPQTAQKFPACKTETLYPSNNSFSFLLLQVPAHHRFTLCL